jgi:hypothetical protein
VQKGVERLDLVEQLEAASAVSAWGAGRWVERVSGVDIPRLRAFLEVDLKETNRDQGVALFAESFDGETLAAAGWLRAQYGVGIELFRTRLAVDPATAREYLACQDAGPDAARVYARRRSEAPDGAPWPPDVVPDISDGAAPTSSAPPAPSLADTAETAPPAAKAAPPAVEPAANGLEAELAEALGQPYEPPPPVSESPTHEAFEAPAEFEDDEDPLAQFFAEQSKSAPWEPGQGDRRDGERRREYQARRLRLDYFGRLLGARLVDVSDTGIGVEALTPLPVGTEVGVVGELVGPDGILGVQGRARVEHCESREDGVCRIGFSIDRSALRPLGDAESFDRR